MAIEKGNNMLAKIHMYKNVFFFLIMNKNETTGGEDTPLCYSPFIKLLDYAIPCVILRTLSIPPR